MPIKRFILFILLFLPMMTYGLPLNETALVISANNNNDSRCLVYAYQQSTQWSCSHRQHTMPVVSRLDALAQAALKKAEIRQQVEALLSRGDSAFDHDDFLQAEQAYRQALKISPELTAAWLRLAQFYVALNREKDALQILHNGVKNLPEAADLYFEAGLIEVRLRQFAKAIISLAKAAQLAQENPHFSYVYGIALNSYQRPEEALEVLHQALSRHPDNQQLLQALVAINRDNHHYRVALKYAEKLAVLEPGKPQFQEMLLQISAAIKSSENQGNK